MSIETHNHLMRIAVSLVISVVFWVGLELLAADHFSLRHVVGGTMLTTLFLYAITTKAEAEKKARQERDGSEDIS